MATRQTQFLGSLHQALGTPYVWGGSAPGGYDCSGLVYWAAHLAGIKGVPRTSQEQWNFGKPIALNGLKPGDLVFSEPGPGGPGHVGIYIGHGQIESAPHTGATVHISTMAQFGSLMGARRILANPQGNVVSAGQYKTPQGNVPVAPQQQQAPQFHAPVINLPTLQHPAMTAQQTLQTALKPLSQPAPGTLGQTNPLQPQQVQMPQVSTPNFASQLGALHDHLLKLGTP